MRLFEIQTFSFSLTYKNLQDLGKEMLIKKELDSQLKHIYKEMQY